MNPESMIMNGIFISPAALVWLGYAPDVAAAFTCVWFVYRFVKWAIDVVKGSKE